jgi:hypothetical protein
MKQVRHSVMILLISVPLAASAEGAGAIYTWTDQAGVLHFSDAPPRPAAASADTGPLPLDEDTPVPETLNELLAPSGAADDAALGITPAGGITTPVPYQPGSGAIPPAPAGSALPVPAGGPTGDALSVEELEALDPIWLRQSDPGATELYVDQHGPFTIGEPIGDAHVPPERRCAAARRDLEVLRDAWPVYRDQAGRLRFQWERDPYRGARRYLDAEARKMALAGVRQTLARDCAAAEDPEAQSAARAALMKAALCEAERAELQAMESLGGDGPTQTLTDKRALAARVCGEPPPDQS